MRRLALALALVCACGEKGDAPRSIGADVKPFVPPAPAASLGDFLPPRLGEAGRQALPDYMKVREGDAHAAYLSGADGAMRTINVNLRRVDGGDLPAARDLLDAGDRFEVRGHRVHRATTPEARRTEARALVGDAVVVTVTVDNATDVDESVRLMAELDLAGIQAFAAAAR